MPVEGPQYPVNLVLTGRRCLVVGGGRVAARKVEGLVAAGAEVTVVAPAVAVEITALGVTVEEREYEAGEAAGYHLVVTATGSRAVIQAVYDAAEAARVWVNSADDPERCSFTLPAVVRRGPLMVTVSTGGHSPAVASWLRGRLERELGPEYETLVAMLSEQRRTLQAEGRSTEGLNWQSALDSDMLDLIREGRIPEAWERLKACLSSS
ncbi:MAG TPA: bifunctional precorrin-2 dehydrogenase/sirohydrochlorin ferrochelatase [Acidimicrobiales bacterium]|nr:bifunctional precorrin-2 dehydrogenase/sirohydrochlorin ferrochelatase [Acidimicrobiales bacterium]